MSDTWNFNMFCCYKYHKHANEKSNYHEARVWFTETFLGILTRTKLPETVADFILGVETSKINALLTSLENIKRRQYLSQPS